MKRSLKVPSVKTRILQRQTVTGDQSNANLLSTVRWLMGWVGVSTGVLLLQSLGASIDVKSSVAGLDVFFSEFSMALLIAASSLSIGVLFGFLFGIPRTVQGEIQPQSSTNGVQTSTGSVSGKRQYVNTNLEQISDWLTKILVGFGLTQLQRIPDEIWKLGQAFPISGKPALGVALILNYLVSGFFCGYLLTRLFLAGAFILADEESLARLTERASAFEEVGKYDEAFSEYKQALSSITPTTSSTEKRSIYEGLVFNSLYEKPPEGYKKAIEYAEQYLKEEPQFASGRLYAYLAAALGQKYKDLRDKKVNDAELDNIKREALQAVEQAIKREPNIITLLQTLWDPKRSKSPGDDDLEVFANDPDFAKLLGPLLQ